jgi:hypothetical protein
MYHDIYFLKFFTVRNIFSCKESICTQGQKEIADFVVNKKGHARRQSPDLGAKSIMGPTVRVASPDA